MTAIPETTTDEQLALRLMQSEHEREALLDILNAVLANAGGKVVIPSVELQAATRRRISVEHGDGYMAIELEQPKAPKGSRRDLVERAQSAGIKLP